MHNLYSPAAMMRSDTRVLLTTRLLCRDVLARLLLRDVLDGRAAGVRPGAWRAPWCSAAGCI
jgi:hypothetical protein